MSMVPPTRFFSQKIKLAIKKVTLTTAFVILGGYLLLASLIWAFSPIAVNYFISQYVSTHDLDLASETQIRYNPFVSKLTINDLSLSHQDTIVFSLPTLVLQISMFDLLSQQINVEKLLVDGAYLLVDSQPQILTVAGLSLGSATEPASGNVKHKKSVAQLEDTQSESIQPEDVQSQQKQPLLNTLQLIMPNMQLTNANIELHAQGQSHVFHIEDLTINVAKITSRLQNVSLNMLAQINNADVSLQASTELTNQQGDIRFKVDVADVDLQKFKALFAPHIALARGFMSYKGAHEIQLSQQGLRLQVRDLLLATEGLEVNKNDIHLALLEQSFSSSSVTFDLPLNKSIVTGPDNAENPVIKITGDGSINWQDLTIFNHTSNKTLAAVAHLGLHDVSFTSKAEKVLLSINEMQLTDTFFSNNTDNEMPALALFKELMIDDIELNNNSLSMNTINLAGLQSNIQLNPEKQIENLIITANELSQALGLSTKNASASPGSVPDSELDSEPNLVLDSEINSGFEAVEDQVEFNIKFNQFLLTDSATVEFSDRSVSPNYNRYVEFNELTIGPVDTSKPADSTQINVKGSSNQYATFTVVIKAKPFLEAAEYEILGQLSQMELAALTAYVKDALGYEIESGQLDLNLDLVLKGSAIQGDSHLLLRGIELSSLENYEKNDKSNDSYIPFNAALGMLKDGDGNVDLNLPISGDTSRPSFGLSGFVTLLVKRATIAAAKDYLTMTFVPYASLVKVVIAADKHLLKLEINNLNYPATVTQVGADHQEFITTFTELLNDKSDLQIKLCGVSTAVDIGKQVGDQLSAVDIENLIKISEQRGSMFKQYMVEEKQIESSRLLLCKPRIDNSFEAVPHIKFET